MDGYENLANAIILQAVKDYKRTLRLLQYQPEDEDALESKREIEQFFRSSWFADLTEADGDIILQSIRLKFKRKKAAK